MRRPHVCTGSRYATKTSKWPGQAPAPNRPWPRSNTPPVVLSYRGSRGGHVDRIALGFIDFQGEYLTPCFDSGYATL